MQKIDILKLLDLVHDDSRIPNIICKKFYFSTKSLDDLKIIRNIKDEELDVLMSCESGSELISRYNESIRLLRKDLDNLLSYWSKENYIHWKILNDENKRYEIEQWAGGACQCLFRKNKYK